MRASPRWAIAVPALMLLLGAAACEVLPPGEGEEVHGTLSVALSGATHDVTGFLFEIECDSGFTASEFVPLEDEPMPTWLTPMSGSNHPFSDLFVALPPGHCVVTATPMQDPDTPSTECHPVTDEFDVVPEQTTEIVLMAQCDGDPVGIGDIVAGLNDPPHIDDIELDPGKFVCVGEEVTITVTASDPNDDPMTYDWSVTAWPEAPAPGSFTLTPTGETAIFVGDTAGQYELTVTITDTFGATATVSFPIHVSDGEECAVCCKDHGEFTVVPPADCPPTQQQPMELCADVCCRTEDTFQILPAGACPEGNQTAIEECADVCCKIHGTYLTVPAGECPNGAEIADELCEEVCCELPNGAIEWRPAGLCPPNAVVPDEVCDERCDCPEGFQPTPDGSECRRYDTIAATSSGNLYAVSEGHEHHVYGLLGARYPGGTVVTNSYWGPGATSEEGRLNVVGVWAEDGDPTDSVDHPLNEWIGFAVCVDIPAAGDYLVGMAADNEMRFFLNDDPAPVFEMTWPLGDVMNFRYWWVNKLTLAAGPNIVRLEGRNLHQIAAFGADISGPFPAGSLDSDAAMIAADYAGNIVFSTADVIGGYFQSGEQSGWQCPDGYYLDSCNPEMACVRVETAPCE